MIKPRHTLFSQGGRRIESASRRGCVNISDEVTDDEVTDDKVGLNDGHSSRSELERTAFDACEIIRIGRMGDHRVDRLLNQSTRANTDS
ncbi:hypothetical protein SAPIO_CDS2609 [Scedosporium apiospermum]|uniref:Uncharacterized protein n=1 Tax=Pseudallescheria apiosperma TaxID=563466 RepID=A0A084GCU9_PSEDA|nr:uncharacterized protein SAPIO_CDS2609 [Scedosporium apiospermum]KEZ45161.1 hypothetical protein SAPIO_CDS2609 [Scedosporium apiospermum]